MSTFLKNYRENVVPALMKELGISNVNAVPKITKIVVNIGAGQNARDAQKLAAMISTVARITGQKPVETKAKISISNFKVRKGMTVGVKVTLRGPKMYDFMEKLINVTFPRVRDFQGVTTHIFDGHGNASIGFKEQLAFPEITADDIENIHGLQVVVSTTAKDDVQAKALFKQLGFPFKRNEN